MQANMHSMPNTSFRLTTLLSRLTPVLALLLLPMSVLAQQEYQHGHGTLQLFDGEGMDNTPQWVMLWIYFMLASFAASLLFVKSHKTARWVAACFITGFVVMTVATELFGVPPLSGFIALIHLIAWTPALIVLLKRRPFLGPVSAFSVWSGVMTGVIIFSFIFDIRDAAIFVAHHF